MRISRSQPPARQSDEYDIETAMPLQGADTDEEIRQFRNMLYLHKAREVMEALSSFQRPQPFTARRAEWVMGEAYGQSDADPSVYENLMRVKMDQDEEFIAQTVDWARNARPLLIANSAMLAHITLFSESNLADAASELAAGLQSSYSRRTPVCWSVDFNPDFSRIYGTLVANSHALASAMERIVENDKKLVWIDAILQGGALPSEPCAPPIPHIRFTRMLRYQYTRAAPADVVRLLGRPRPTRRPRASGSATELGPVLLNNIAEYPAYKIILSFLDTRELVRLASTCKTAYTTSPVRSTWQLVHNPWCTKPGIYEGLQVTLVHPLDEGQEEQERDARHEERVRSRLHGQRPPRRLPHKSTGFTALCLDGTETRALKYIDRLDVPLTEFTSFLSDTSLPDLRRFADTLTELCITSGESCGLRPSDISALVNLVELSIDSVLITPADVENAAYEDALLPLVHLRRLSMGDGAADLWTTKLHRLASLRQLDLFMEDDPISSEHLRDVGRCTQLTSLKLSSVYEAYHGAHSISPLENLVNLEHLTVECMRAVEDLAPLSRLHKLRSLRLVMLPDSEAPRLKCPHLTDLTISAVPRLTSRDLRSLYVETPRLRRLDLAHNHGLTDLLFVGPLLLLEKLDVTQCPHIVDFIPLYDHPSLRTVSISKRPAYTFYAGGKHAQRPKFCVHRGADDDETPPAQPNPDILVDLPPPPVQSNTVF